MAQADSELDPELDEDTEDTDLEDENSDEGKDEEDTEDDADESDEGDSPEDDDKPLTRGELKKILASNQNKNNAARRVASKKVDLAPKTPKAHERLDRVEQSLAKTELLERKRQFAYENNLSPEETDHVFKLTKRPTKKFLDQPFVKGGLEAIRSARNVRANTPGSTGRSFQANGKSWSDLKPEEKEANFADRRKAILESKKNQ